MKKYRCFDIGKNIVIAIFGYKRGSHPRFESYDDNPFADGWTLRLGRTVIDYSPSGFGIVGHNTSEVVFKPWWKKW